MNLTQIKNMILKYGRIVLWDDVSLRTLFEENKLLSSEWLNYKKDFSYSPPDLDNAITYAGCKYVEFYVKNKLLMLDLKIYEGDSMYGNPQEERCLYTFHIRKLSPGLNRIFNSRLHDIVMYKIQKEEEEKMAERILNKTEQILNGLSKI